MMTFLMSSSMGTVGAPTDFGRLIVMTFALRE
ncbi:hypothetical protein X961_5843 [Burkholderia pseudomallei MSHR5613]|nr:hypothetical protein X961_5843 [Burkholderia pseudomallei MSHR5613]